MENLICGYNWENGKSNRAVHAEEEKGLATATAVAKATGTSSKFIADEFCPSEWHHTGKMYKQTDYYDIYEIKKFLEENPNAFAKWKKENETKGWIRKAEWVKWVEFEQGGNRRRRYWIPNEISHKNVTLHFNGKSTYEIVFENGKTITKRNITFKLVPSVEELKAEEKARKKKEREAKKWEAGKEKREKKAEKEREKRRREYEKEKRKADRLSKKILSLIYKKERERHKFTPYYIQNTSSKYWVVLKGKKIFKMEPMKKPSGFQLPNLYEWLKHVKENTDFKAYRDFTKGKLSKYGEIGSIRFCENEFLEFKNCEALEKAYSELKK